LLLDLKLERFRGMGLLKAHGRQPNQAVDVGVSTELATLAPPLVRLTPTACSAADLAWVRTIALDAR
jgi:hypothetical protein